MSLALQRFEGPTVEAALADAVRALGSSLKVLEAKRIRKGGVLGFFSREHFQVVAERGGPTTDAATTIDLTAPLPATAPFAPGAVHDRVDATLRALVEDVESREVTSPVASTPAVPPPAPFAPQVAQAADAYAAAPMTADAFLETIAHGHAEPAAPVAPTRFTDDDLAPLTVDADSILVDAEPLVFDVEAEGDGITETAAAFYDFEEMDAQPCVTPPRWTRTALRDLGLPAAVLRALPQRAPTNDQAWLKGLEKALSRTIPAPLSHRAGPVARVVGEGAESAVAIIRGGVAGIAPGELILDGEAHPATAAVLARAVRACLPR